MQTPWFWVKVLLLIGVVGWLVVFTGSAILLEMVLYFALHLASIPEPYLRLEGQTYSWITVIRWCGSFAIWFFYGKWVWKKLIRRKSVISDGEDSEGKGDPREKSLQEKNFLRDPGYKGEYKNGKFHGTGTFTYENGTTYTGKWKDGLPHGKGTQRSPNGRTLAGQWKSGEFLGESASKKVTKKSSSKKVTKKPASKKVAKKSPSPPATSLSDSQIQKWSRVEVAVVNPFLLIATLCESDLSDAGLDKNQKAVFNSLIILGLLEQLNARTFNGELPNDLVFGTLQEHLLKSPFNFDKRTASRIVFAADRGRSKLQSYADLRFLGTQRLEKVIGAFSSNPVDTTATLMKAWSIKEIYLDSELLNKFKSEYKKI